MDIHKIIILSSVLLIACSCSDQTQIAILEAENAELKEEYESLKRQNDQNKKNILSQTEAINEALSELSEISGRTTALRLNVESGNAKLTQAEKLHANISNLKERLEILEKSLANNSELKKTVVALKTVIAEKEKEINELRIVISEQTKTIEKQDEIIDLQSFTINNQLELIEKKNRELQSSLKSQIELIYQSGCKFEEIANMDLDVSFKKNKKKVADFKRMLQLKALEYYKAASDKGHHQAKVKYEALYDILY